MFCPPPSGLRAAAVTILMATWWITEAIPIPATALVPIALFPVLSVMDSRRVALQYDNQNIYYFMGGFCIAMAMQIWNP
ncbi:MAG: anion permease [Candidatus Tritonobacter lacicola]|nr:anion permease [Candidatus Tritonobacter lacicola]